MSLSVTIPIQHKDSANIELSEKGFGECFSVPLTSGQTNEITHSGFHAWTDEALLTALSAMDYPGLQVTHIETGGVHFDAHLENHGLGKLPEIEEPE